MKMGRKLCPIKNLCSLDSSLRVIGLSLFLLFNSYSIGHAEQLPVRNFTAADGLPRDSVSQIKQDSRGFIWMITGDGISRFDGYTFTNYTTGDGLPDRRVNDLLETRAGVYWIATQSGLCRFNPTGRRAARVESSVISVQQPAIKNQNSEIGNPDTPLFVVYNPGANPITFNSLLEDEGGVIWCATSEGLYRMEVSPDGKTQFRLVNLGMPSEKTDDNIATAILKDHQGGLWVGSFNGALYRLLPDGGIERYAQQHGLPGTRINALFEDRERNIWVATRRVARGLPQELFRLVAAPQPAHSIVAQTYGAEDGLASLWVNFLYQTRDGKLWVGTADGLFLFTPGSERLSTSDGGHNAPGFQLYNAKNGLCDSDVWDADEDRDGNLWVASRCGAAKVSRNGFTAYGPDDGLGSLLINAMFETQEGALTVINSAERTNRPTGYFGRIVNQFDGSKFTAVEPNLPSSVTYHGWGWGQTILHDRTGEWWIPTGMGLYRFPKVDRIEDLSRVKPQLVRTLGNDSNHVEIFRLYEDSRGDIWIATAGIHTGLLRWERATNSVHDLTSTTNVPPKTIFTSFCEDNAGNLWIAASEGGGLLRYHGGKLERFTIGDGIPAGWILWLHLDLRGRLWMGSSIDGLNRIDEPTADAPHISRRFTTADGLSSNDIRTITEDRWGRIYVGTGHGVDRLDAETGNVKHYTSADGLPKGMIEASFRDHEGALWFSSWFGLSRLVPERNESSWLPAVYITGLHVEGVAQRISELGELNPHALELASNQHQVNIDFVGLGASVGDELRYQYRLEGAGNDWSVPTTQHTVNYANLASGNYRFLVRAINADGQVNPQAASFSFNISAPIWQRAPFWILAALIITIVTFALYRYRVSRLLEVANMRTRIATDLHDDIGANLTRIAILSEVARQQLGNGNLEPDSPLSAIARISRESVASMSDIVWAINPQRDSLLDLVRRMRRQAEEIFTTRDIPLKFVAPEIASHHKLSVDVRRDLFLIFKEALNNAARHSRCTHVSVALSTEGAWLTLEIADNGIGFDSSTDNEGQGLLSMQRRAENLGGALNIETSHGEGTIVKLCIPFARSRSFLPTSRRK
jgi:ligand-binding sensor domain-containing protein/signal transduction histidine kinase